MEKLTKEKRNQVYRDALVLFKNGYTDGICCAIAQLHFENAMKHELVTAELFPEFFNKKPINTPGIYWFGSGRKGLESRIEILKQCIEETNP